MLDLLAHRHIRYFCLAVILLAFISGALRTAIPLMATQAGYSVAAVGQAQGLFSLAWPVFGIVAGTLLDRHDKVKLAARAILISALLHAGALAAMLMRVNLSEYIFLYAVVAGVIVVSAEAYIMTIPPLIMEGAKLTSFYSIVLFLDFGFSYFLGPVTASIVLARSQADFFLLVIITFLMSLFCVKTAVPDLPAADKPAMTAGYIMAGFRFIFSSQPLTCLTVLTFFLSVAFGAFLTSFIFFVTDSRHLGLDSSRYGIMFAAYALGTMAGALGARRLSGPAPVRTAVLADSIGTVALLVAPAFSNSIAVVWGTTFLAGAGLSLWFVCVTAFRQQCTPQDLLGRANAAFRVMGYAGLPAGSFLTGILGTLMPLPFAVSIIAGLLLAALAGTLPFLWSADRVSLRKQANPS